MLNHRKLFQKLSATPLISSLSGLLSKPTCIIPEYKTTGEPFETTIRRMFTLQDFDPGYERQDLGVIVEHGKGCYQIEQLSTPIVWSFAFEARNPLQTQREKLALGMVSNAIDLHGEQLYEMTATHRLVLAKEYSCTLGEVQTIGEKGKVLKIYTVFVKMPK